MAQAAEVDALLVTMLDFVIGTAPVSVELVTDLRTASEPDRTLARRIVRAVRKRRRLLVITHHARVAIFLQRYFPRLLPALFSLLRLR